MALAPNQVQAAFLQAVELSPADRPAFLDRECGADPDLRHRVESLLMAHDRSGRFLDSPVLSAITPCVAPEGGLDDDHAGTWVGPYRLVEPLGKGGMGVVWVAEQEKPVRRRVAVKLIKPGMDSAHILHRFEAERQALALMDHPNIATILDAGVAGSGRPYFVMELVKGVPITTYCDELNLSVRERLAQFVDVCRAVQHAHQKGVIHRDLKPSNVLVCIQDGRPVPKVIDFGIAKAVGQKLAEDTLYTAVGAIVGTLQYMSPEQAELRALDIDTRADVYGLGVLLYELLTGTTPLESARLRTVAFTETLRLIREEEPPKPSTRLSESKESLATVAARRHTEPARLTKEVRGELDWIVMKCLEKDRTRRYDTANALLRDVERFLADEPVEAGPPSAGYRVRKFVRRNRRGVIAAGAVLACLVLGMAGTTAGLVWALNERDAKENALQVAVTNENQAVQATELAQHRLGQVDRANEILESIFRDLNPGTNEKQGKQLRVILGERLDQATAQLDEETVGDRLTVARLQNTLGHCQLELGYPDKAIVLLTKSRQTREDLLGLDHTDTLWSRHNLAQAYLEVGRRAEALSLLEENLKRRRNTVGPTHLDTLNSMNTLGEAYRQNGRIREALGLIEEVEKISRETLRPTHPDRLRFVNNLAALYYEEGRWAEAVQHLTEALKLAEQTLGPTHANTLAFMANLAAGYDKVGKKAESLRLEAEVLRLRREHLGPTHSDTLASMHGLAHAYGPADRRTKALPLLEEVVKLRKIHLTPTHPDTLWSMNSLAFFYRQEGMVSKAVPLQEETLKLMRETLPPAHQRLLACMNNMIRAYVADGQYGKAMCLLDEFLPIQRSQLGPKSRFLPNVLLPVSEDLLVGRQYAMAEPLLREALALRAEIEPDAWTTFRTQSLLGWSLLGQKRYPEAEPQLVQGYRGMKQREVKIPANVKARLAEATDRLVELYTAWGKPSEAEQWRTERARYPTERAPPPRSVR